MGVRVREKDGTWYVFIAHNGRRRAKKVGDKKAAERVAKGVRERLAAGDLHLPGSSPTFAAFAKEWLDRYPLLQPVRPGTMANHRSFLTHHLVPFFGSMQVGTITSAALENFIIAKRSPGGCSRFEARPLSESSLRTGLATLRLVLQQAVRADHLQSNPLADLGRIRRNGDENVDPFTSAELRTILDAAHRVNPDFGVMLRLWAQSGMRAGEVSALQWQDLDLEAGTAIVRRTWSRQQLGPTKTGLIRSVSFLHPTTEATAEWRPGKTAESRTVLTGLRKLTVRSLEPSGFVFGGGTQPMHSMEIHRTWKRVLGAARVRYRPAEQFRHSFASTLLCRNAPLLYVQKQGGWRSASVLLRVYARWVPDGIENLQPAATQKQPTADVGA